HGGVVVGCRRRGDLLRIEVSDSGPGIPEAQRSRIFEEFYQLAAPQRDRGGGIGLGLAIVERLCRLLDHPIELASKLGKGSRFTVVVPAAPAQPVSPAAVLPWEAGETLPARTAVVIDDSALVLDGMSGLLRGWGFRVIAADTCQQALALIAERGERPDLIV